MNGLHIIQASAGSGKTHRLALFFLELLLRENLDYFKSILGVTFTNKATGEMKRRILEQLHRLACGAESDFFDVLVRIFNGNEEKLRNKSSVLLRKILHQYSWFSIETIDTFFQRIIRTFTRELGIPGNYTIEIDIQPILQYAVDQLLDELGDNTDMLDWLIRYAENKIAEGKGWDVRRDLTALGYEIFKEEFASGAVALTHALEDRKKLFSFHDKLFGITSAFEKKCTDIGAQGLKHIEERGLETHDFFQKSNGPVRFFKNLRRCSLKNSQDKLITETPLIEKLLENPENWASSDTKRRAEVTELATGFLHPLLVEIDGFFGSEYSTYATALVIRKNLFTVGILADLMAKVRQYRFEKNVFILSDAPQLLNRIINQNDAPFVYEKMGNRYGHFLIDEFQDTSKLQWNNFRPLIMNSLAQGKQCLIVGDVKQAIYRWRNGDWDILARKIYNEYAADVVRREKLDTNWRSGGNIVNFNNDVFHTASEILREELQQIVVGESSNTPSYFDTLRDIYADISQVVPEKNRDKGNVYIRFFPNSEVRESPEYYAEPLIATINNLLGKGYAQKDIALLVRTKKQGKTLVDMLIQANNESKFCGPVEIISNESLFLSASNTVNLLIAAIQCLNTPDENLCWSKLAGSYEAHTRFNGMATEDMELSLDAGFFNRTNALKLLPPDFINNFNELSSLSLYEMVEQLATIFGAYRHEYEIPYVHALLDLIFEFSQANPPGIQEFLDYWSEQGKIQSVPAAELQQAIRIITIHKAKGLEFRAVIIPFCNWDLNQKTNSVFWVRPSDRFADLPLLPLNFTKTLKDTCFAGDYYQEMFKSYVDNLNLLYVAFTRAIETLIVFPVYNDSERNTGNINTVGSLLYACLSKGNLNQNGCFDDSGFVYQVNAPDGIPLDSPQPIESGNYIHASDSKPAISRLYFNTYGYEYFQDTTLIQDKRIRGRVLHGLLANMLTVSDIDKTIREAVFEGTISDDEGSMLKEHILSGMQNQIVNSWFNGEGKVYTESEILVPGKTSRRPDRVIVWPDKVHILDFKFSTDHEIELHRLQVKEYMTLVAQLEPGNVSGFIWYIDKNEVVEI